MKFREKAFLLLLILFVGIFNLGMFYVMRATYKEELSSVKEKAIGEAYFIRTSIAKDMTNVESSMELTFDMRSKIFQEYCSYYKNEKVFLELWNGTSKEASDFPPFKGKRPELNIEEGVQNIGIRTIHHKKYLIVSSTLSEPYQRYKVVYIYDLEHLVMNHNHLVRMLICVDIIVSVVLAILLYFVLSHLVKPLGILSKATQKIAKGEYDISIDIKSNDEFALLAQQFNQMAFKIKNNVDELQLEAEKKQRLIDNMAHELRTPLTSIGGYAQYLRIAQVNEEERIQALNYIMNESKRMEQLSKSILTMADIRESSSQEDTMEQEMEWIPTNELIDYLKAFFLDRQVIIEYENQADGIKGNRTQVESLFINLIENAIRASKENGKIKVRFEQQEQLIIQVCDEGIGMTQEEMDKIEEPFYRADKARSRKSGGVGLGVSICKLIVEAHKATMTYESQKNVGTVVTIKWPASIKE